MIIWNHLPFNCSCDVQRMNQMWFKCNYYEYVKHLNVSDSIEYKDVWLKKYTQDWYIFYSTLFRMFINRKLWVLIYNLVLFECVKDELMKVDFCVVEEGWRLDKMMFVAWWYWGVFLRLFLFFERVYRNQDEFVWYVELFFI